MKTRLLFVITQFYKGGAETALLQLFHSLPPEKYDVDFLVLNDQPLASGQQSLLAQVPAWVRVHNFMQAERQRGALVRAWHNTPGQHRRAAAMLREGGYAWAFQVGEWSSPAFVARRVQAAHKAAWIHADLDKAPYFRGKQYFKWDSAFTCYLFVSEDSRKSSEAAWPALRGKSRCVHNVVDAATVRQFAAAGLQPEDEAFFARGLPVVFTCANVRPEKNHLRQVQAMALLKQRGVDFLWLNAGILQENGQLAHQLRTAIRAAGLEDRCFMLGARENPYSMMQKAEALTVFSDSESWSMVITEALALGKPVLATRTSGALAQIAEGVDGLLCDFTAEAIADTLERFLADATLRGRLAAGAAARSGQLPAGLVEFEALIAEREA
ncbi:MAG: glycosyltransferase [Ruminococcaceae bacterium]|nr:glycosyltransferase [Oscillospiraceae bacterium]